jgi:hypothetical protein
MERQQILKQNVVVAGEAAVVVALQVHKILRLFTSIC